MELLCHEHLGTPRHWRVDEAEFAGNLADLVALELERSERRAAEGRWASVVDEIMEAVFVLDPQLTIVQMNARGRALLDRIGGALRLEDRLQAVEYRDLNGKIYPREQMPPECAARGQSSTDVLTAWSKQDGFLGSFRVTATPIKEHGRVESIVVVLQDVTTDVLDEQRKSEFLSALAHELKTPAAVVKGFTQLLLDDSRLPPACDVALATIEKASLRTELLIEDAVDMAGVTVGRLALSRDRLDLRGLVESVVAATVVSAPHHLIRISGSTHVDVVLDRPRIEQVMHRLLENAVRFSAEGDSIDVEIVAERAIVTVRVRDHGIGISAARLPFIFDAFSGSVGDAHGVRGGLGIGLYLAREIVRLHGGDMTVDSVEGKGSTFAFWLPREVRL